MMKSRCASAYALVLSLGCSVETLDHEPEGSSKSEGTVKHGIAASGVPLSSDGPVNVVSGIEGETTDLELVAEAKGWTFEQAVNDRRATDAVGDAAVKLAELEPNVFVGSAIDDEPGAIPELLVKGAASSQIRNMVREISEKTDVPIHIADGQPFAFYELEERSERASEALQKVGFKEVMVAVHIRRGRLEVKARRRAGLPSKAADVLQNLPASVRSIADVELQDDVLMDTDADWGYGGMLAKDGSRPECTAGWALKYSGSLGFDFGMAMSGHCGGITKVQDAWGDNPVGSTSASVKQHVGPWGDIEVRKTLGYTPSALFRASSSQYRWTWLHEPSSHITVGESICTYAPPPWSNVRKCSADVEAVSVSCLGAGRLVRMDKYLNQDGESGAGWSWNYTAYGAHVGQCSGNSVFSVAAYFEEAIDSRVLGQGYGDPCCELPSPPW